MTTSISQLFRKSRPIPNKDATKIQPEVPNDLGGARIVFIAEHLPLHGNKGKPGAFLYFLLADFLRLGEALHIPVNLRIREGAKAFAVISDQNEWPGDHIIPHMAVALHANEFSFIIAE